MPKGDRKGRLCFCKSPLELADSFSFSHTQTCALAAVPIFHMKVARALSHFPSELLQHGFRIIPISPGGFPLNVQ